jgi:hypothetical protein
MSQQRLSTDGGSLDRPDVAALFALKAKFKEAKNAAANSKQSYFKGVTAVVVAADGTKIDVSNRWGAALALVVAIWPARFSLLTALALFLPVPLPLPPSRSRDADWSGASKVLYEMPCGALLSTGNAWRTLPTHVGSRACKGKVCGDGRKRKGPAAAAAAAGEDEELSDAEPVLGGGARPSAQELPPQQKRSKKGPLDSFMPAASLKEKVGPSRRAPGRGGCCCCCYCCCCCCRRHWCCS